MKDLMYLIFHKSRFYPSTPLVRTQEITGSDKEFTRPVLCSSTRISNPGQYKFSELCDDVLLLLIHDFICFILTLISTQRCLMATYLFSISDPFCPGLSYFTVKNDFYNLTCKLRIFTCKIVKKCVKISGSFNCRNRNDSLPAFSTPRELLNRPYVRPIVEKYLSNPAEDETASTIEQATSTKMGSKPMRRPPFHHESDETFLKLEPNKCGEYGGIFPMYFIKAGRTSLSQESLIYDTASFTSLGFIFSPV